MVFVLSLSFFCTEVASVTKTKILLCVNIVGNKAHSDSDSENDKNTEGKHYFFYSVHENIMYLIYATLMRS